MKKLLGYMVFFGMILIPLYFFLNYRAVKKEERIETERRKQELEDMRSKELQRSRLLAEEERRRQQQRLEDRKRREDLVSGRRGTTTIAIPTPLPPSSVQSAFRHRTKVETACREARCALVRYEETGASSFIVVQGPDHSSVSNVLDSLIRVGMKDFTEYKEQYKVEMLDGRRVYTAAYTIKW